MAQKAVRANLLEEVHGALVSAGLEANERVVVGISGGPDSVALLSLLVQVRERLPLRAIAAHLEHGIRGRESESDMEFVEEFCLGLGVPLVDFRAHLGEDASEAEAREARLSFFRLVYDAWRAKALLLAHHSDDLIETMLFRMLRGAPPEGLPGFGPVEEIDGMKVVRPLRNVKRSTIIGYVEERRLPYRLDSSNLTTKYVRNAFRQEVLPAFERLVPGARESLAALAGELSADEAALSSMAAAALRKALVHRMPGFAVINHAALTEQEEATRRRMVHLLIPQAGRDAAAIVAGLDDGATTTLAGDVSVRRDGGRLLICDASALPIPAEPAALPVPGKAALPDGSHVRARVVKLGGKKPKDRDDALVEYLSPDALPPGGLTVRKRQPGDRFHPLGGPGSRKLQDFMVDAGVPKELRDAAPLVIAGDEIAWVAGVRMSERFRLKRRAKEAVKLEVGPRRSSYVRVIADLAAER